MLEQPASAQSVRAAASAERAPASASEPDPIAASSAEPQASSLGEGPGPSKEEQGISSEYGVALADVLSEDGARRARLG